MEKREFFFAQKAFILNGGDLLVVRKSMDDPHNPGLWEVPGGRMTFGEDVDAHLRREVREEVGLEVEPGEPFHVWQWQLSRNQNGEQVRIQIVAVARLCAARHREVSFDGRVEGDFLGEAQWVAIAELRNLKFIPNMNPVLDSLQRRVKA